MKANVTTNVCLCVVAFNCKYPNIQYVFGPLFKPKAQHDFNIKQKKKYMSKLKKKQKQRAEKSYELHLKQNTAR